MPRSLAEQDARQMLEKQGWTVFTRGYPDFLCIRDGKIKFVEVKLVGEKLRPDQQKVAQALGNAQINVEILRPCRVDSRSIDSRNIETVASPPDQNALSLKIPDYFRVLKLRRGYDNAAELARALVLEQHQRTRLHAQRFHRREIDNWPL